VRHFPRTARPRLAAATLACALAAGGLAIPIANAVQRDPKDLKDRQHHAQAQVRHAQHDLDESSSRLQKAQAAVDRAVQELDAARADYRSASTRLAAAEVRDQEMQDRLDDAEARLAQAQSDLAAGQADLEAQRLHVTDTVTDIYEQGDPALLAFATLLESKSTTDLTRQEALNDAIVGREARAYDDLHAAEVLLQVTENEVESARDDVEVQREAAAEHLVTMEALHQETLEAKERVRASVDSRRDARADAVQARQADLRALQAARKRESHIKQLILAAAARAHGGYRGSVNGLFIRPVPGYITSPFGYREHPIYHYWGLHDGTDFGVSCGEGMRAVATGTVIAQYYSSVYGNRLYLSLGQINGKNVTAVYNHATGYRYGVGDRVQQGDVVGWVGSTGWSTGCHLHFTILVNGTAVDPMNWLP
jgi:murein DD-endopeptidase MepM/ murein hydrolase activator NlpD